MDIRFFDRLIPSFTISVSFGDQLFSISDNSDILELSELGNWIKQVNGNNVFKEDFFQFVKNKKSSHSLAFINTKIKQINCVLIYLVVKKDLKNKVDLKFYNLIELAYLLSNSFTKELWKSLNECIVKEHNNLIRRNLETGYIALEPLFTLCYSEFHDIGKNKYELGESLFYLNHNYRWDRAGAGYKENSGRVVVQQISKMRKAHSIPEVITSQCLANHQLEQNVLIAM